MSVTVTAAQPHRFSRTMYSGRMNADPGESVWCGPLLIGCRKMGPNFYDQRMASLGTVREWHHDVGWGIVDSPETPNGAWAEWSVVLVRGVIRADGGVYTLGIRPGTDVRFEWTRTAPSIQHCDHRVTAVWPADAQAPVVGPPRGAYRTWLWTLASADPDGLSPAEQVTKLPSAPPIPAMLRIVGTVRAWNSELGWGVLDSAQTQVVRGPTTARSSATPAFDTCHPANWWSSTAKTLAAKTQAKTDTAIAR